MLADTVSGGQSSGDFIVKDGRGTLTVRSSGEWTVAIYRLCSYLTIEETQETIGEEISSFGRS
jgi:hypothetical protein